MAREPLPMITIGLTCFNAQDTIRRAIHSALSQTYPNREILIVDDCSIDGSWDIVQAEASAHPEIRVIRHERNKGYPSALNTLVSEARGDFVAFFDDDDESAPQRLARQADRLSEYLAANHSAPSFCYTNRKVFGFANGGTSFTRLGIGRVAPEPSGPSVADFVLGLLKDDGHHCWGMFGSCTLMARREDLRRFGQFDTDFRRCAELDFAVRAALEGAHFISVNEPLVTQFMTPTADKSGLTDLKYKLKLLKKHAMYLKQRRAYLGAFCAVHAQFYRSRSWVWVAWYLAALTAFPPGVAWARLKRASLIARIRRHFLKGARHATE